MKLIKEYDISDDGNCSKCKNTYGNYCSIFKEIVWMHMLNRWNQCQDCKDWLKQQKESKE